MINANKMDRNDVNKIDNEAVLKALDDVYKKLQELEESTPINAF